MRFNEVERDLIGSKRVVKRNSTQCHMPQNTSISVRYTPPPPHVGAPIPVNGVGRLLPDSVHFTTAVSVYY